ncbi:hypothetical protein G5S74_14910 [Legionella pneumophila serogroup 1]|uniref:KAP family P-loop NTPase fold protein n=1 Tax=Legionella pneumophila TaxID=446 RepID=UPI001F4EF767|nr:P-loop NTPase fold protein [Legionella pneumophila]MCH9103684.1 hypothetical protein [Legionella pneumophila serogroup 1]
MEAIELINFEHDDAFNRKPTAEKMIDLLLSDADVSPMLIDGKWGTGKTTFCKKSITLLENRIQDIEAVQKPIKCAYIDAFTADHANQPIITIIAAISKLLDKNSLKTTFIDKAKGVARFSIKTVLKAGAAWVLKTSSEDLGQELTDALKNSSDESIDYTLDNLIKEHEEAESNIVQLKQVLCEITQTQELIIFIDELDRCRPDFAVSLIESIKLIFETPGIQFIMLANFEQIEAAIKHRYGISVDAKRYLDKFLKFSFTLPHEVPNKNHSPATIEHTKSLIKKSKVLNNSRLIEHQYSTFLAELIIHNSLSLREAETFVRYLEIHYTLSKGQALNNYANIYALLYMLVVFIFVFKKELFHKIINKNISAVDLSSLIGITTYQTEIDKKNPSSPQIIAALIHVGLPSKGTKLTQEELDYWKYHFNGFFQDEMKIQTELYDFFINEFRKLRLQF